MCARTQTAFMIFVGIVRKFIYWIAKDFEYVIKVIKLI